MFASCQLEPLHKRDGIPSSVAYVLRRILDFLRSDGDSVRNFDCQDPSGAVSREETAKLQHGHADARRGGAVLHQRRLSRCGEGLFV